MTAAPETVRSHRWELAGLGRAPFKCIGMSENVYTGGGRAQAGGSCDYCGTGIRYEFHCVSSDGKKFKVGCDCIAHCHDAAEEIVVKTQRMMKEHKRAARVAGRAAKRLADAEARKAKWEAERAANLAKIATDPLYLRLVKHAGLATRDAPNGFIVDMRVSMERWGRLTEAQEAAVVKVMDRIEAMPALKAASRHLGAEGERVKLVAKVEMSRCIYASTGNRTYDPDRWMSKLRTTDGAALVWFGSYGLKVGETVTGTATIKKLGEYEGEQQTTITNPRWKEPAQ